MRPRVFRGFVHLFVHVVLHGDRHGALHGHQHRLRARRFDSQDRPQRADRRFARLRSFGRLRFPLHAVDQKAPAHEGPARHRGCQRRQAHRRHLPAHERRRGSRGFGPARGAARGNRRFQAERQVRRCLRRGLFPGPLLSCFGRRQHLPPAPGRNGLDGSLVQRHVLQGVVRQARCPGRGFPPHGMPLQVGRRALHPRQDVVRQPRADAAAGQFAVENHRRQRCRVARHRARRAEPSRRQPRGHFARGGVGEAFRRRTAL